MNIAEMYIYPLYTGIQLDILRYLGQKTLYC